MGTELETLAAIERKAVLDRLNAFQGNRTHTAESLGVCLRTLRVKLSAYRSQGFAVIESAADQTGYSKKKPRRK
jgi:DNA-binding NtrC family response regulator